MPNRHSDADRRSPPALPENFPADFAEDHAGVASWRWYCKKGRGLYGGPILLRCREYPELWSFHGGPNEGSVMSWPIRTGTTWENAHAAYVAWLLTNGGTQ